MSLQVFTTITAPVVAAVLPLVLPTVHRQTIPSPAIMVVLVVALLVRKMAPPLPVGQESPVSGLPVVRVSQVVPEAVVAVVALVLLAPRLQESTGARAGTVPHPPSRGLA